MINSWTFLSLIGGDIIGSQFHQPSVSNWSGVYVLLGSIQLTSSTCGGFSTCKTAPRTWLRVLSIVLEEELKVLDFVEWLNYYYLVLLDCFPFSLDFLTSLIKLII